MNWNFDQLTVIHWGNETNFNIRGYYDGHHLIGVHSISLRFTFFNISSTNNVFYYNPTSSITIPSGAYSLNSFNKYISVSLPLVKVVPSYNGTWYDVCTYPTTTDKQNDTNRIVQAVSTLSTLNKQIENGTVWCERIKMYSNVLNMGQNVGN